MAAIAMTLWLHLLGPTPSGCVPPATAVTVAPPQPVPTVGLPKPVGGPKNVAPWKPKKDH